MDDEAWACSQLQGSLRYAPFCPVHRENGQNEVSLHQPCVWFGDRHPLLILMWLVSRACFKAKPGKNKNPLHHQTLERSARARNCRRVGSRPETGSKTSDRKVCNVKPSPQHHTFLAKAPGGVPAGTCYVTGAPAQPRCVQRWRRRQ